MPVLRLTDIVLRALKPSEERITYWDQTLPALGVRVGRRAKVFIVMHGKARKRVVLGRYPRMTLQAARKKAQALIYGPDTEQPQDGPPAAQAVEQFIDIHHAQSRPSTRKEQRRLLTNHFVSKHARSRSIASHCRSSCRLRTVSSTYRRSKYTFIVR